QTVSFEGDGSEAEGVINKFSNGNEIDFVKIEDPNGIYCGSRLKNNVPVAAAVRITTGRIRVPEFGTRLSRDGRLLNINLVMSTTGDDAPVYNEETKTFEGCDPGNFFGSFCATADFETVVYLRNGGS